MSKTITVYHDEKPYTLEFTRKSIEILERNGFDISDFTKKPMTTIPTLFAGAFIANHKFIKKNIIDEIFDKQTNKMELVTALAEMYNEPIMCMIDDEENADSKKPTWEQSW